ncbi:hypothetical protein T484DRAFT_1953833 [Baffinella frigidus]|nr:hypothetical protein T484DRAFT_1953833 [Cryptophyta sp. CCMP2293]
MSEVPLYSAICVSARYSAAQGRGSQLPTKLLKIVQRHPRAKVRRSTHATVRYPAMVGLYQS